ncbi:MAG: type II toxin-antitoxin system RelE/ParE family toxin [Bacteroidales bacterium]|nr:type II toxin-antitoxin system RelE/ParE family toxin [Bacteroidales bacterium]
MATLYSTGTSNKLKIEGEIVRKFCRVVRFIEAAKDIYDFMAWTALHFEKLQGCKNRYSFRLNKKYRMEVEMEWENVEKTVGIVGIDEISTHYE